MTAGSAFGSGSNSTTLKLRQVTLFCPRIMLTNEVQSNAGPATGIGGAGSWAWSKMATKQA